MTAHQMKDVQLDYLTKNRLKCLKQACFQLIFYVIIYTFGSWQRAVNLGGFPVVAAVVML